jgi:hypothetical protein
MNKRIKKKSKIRKIELNNIRKKLPHCWKITLREFNITVSKFGIKMKLQKRF